MATDRPSLTHTTSTSSTSIPAKPSVVARRRRLVIGAVATAIVAVPVAVVAAPVSPAEVPAGDVPVAGAPGAAAREAVSGLYLPDTISNRTLPSGAVAMRIPEPCATLREVLVAGDWGRDQELQLPAELAAFAAIGGLSPLLVLRQGDDRAFATMSDGVDGCEAVVGLAAQGPVTIEMGPSATSTGDGWTAATRCIDAGDELLVDVSLGGATAGAVISVSIAGSGAERPVSLSDTSDGIVVGGPIGALDVLTTSYAAAMAAGAGGEEVEAQDVLPDGSSLVVVESDGEPQGTASVQEGEATLTGTVQLSGVSWYEEATGASGTGTMSFPFACASLTAFEG